MARSSRQKLKLIYLMDFFLKHTDEQHPATMAQIIAHLASHEISAERKSIYDDIEDLRSYGLDIIKSGTEKKNTAYYVGERTFEVPELKLLVDSVQSSKFITHKKTATLIKKIETLASVHEAQLLNRQVYVANRIKTMNESIYYNVDEIHNGIAANRKIRFKYFDYGVDKERHFRKDGNYYVVSPFAMAWDDENYYLVAFDSDAGFIKHFRIDKMTDISTIDEPRDGLEAFDAFDMGVYAKKVFGMFSGTEENVQLRFSNSLVGPAMDRLGRDIFIVPDGPDHFTVRSNVVVSPQFYAWVVGFGDQVQILHPKNVVDGMREHINKVAALYKEES